MTENELEILKSIADFSRRKNINGYVHLLWALKDELILNGDDKSITKMRGYLDGKNGDASRMGKILAAIAGRPGEIISMAEDESAVKNTK